MTILQEQPVFQRKEPFVIAGPCSAETEQQVVETAIQLKSLGNVNGLRAGIWKPRTRPGSFEGVGEVGLSWLQSAKKESGLPVAIEVANAHQVELALKYNVDILWVGARSTANPFSVQEIANALNGVVIPVMIKNPVNPDIDLWIGALERIEASGRKNLALVHRGFTTYGRSEYRNPPMWQVAIEMKRRYEQIPFFIDPSHICGNTIRLREVIQNAMNLDYDGILIESHINPKEAWSDAAQQVTPNELKLILDAIIWRKEEVNEELDEVLERLRQSINEVDLQLMQLLSKRMSIAQEIGKHKRDNHVAILQTQRWNEMRDEMCKIGEKLGLSKDFILQYFDAIHMESINQQDSIMSK